MTELLKPLSQLCGKVSTEVRKNVLASCVVFRRTESIANSKHLVTYTIDEGAELDFKQLKLRVSQDVEMIAISAREDVCLTLDVLAELAKELNLHLFDRILIYRSGILILCIINTKRENGRSACIEIKDFQRCLHKVYSSRNESLKQVGISVATTAVILAAAIIWKSA